MWAYDPFTGKDLRTEAQKAADAEKLEAALLNAEAGLLGLTNKWLGPPRPGNYVVIERTKKKPTGAPRAKKLRGPKKATRYRRRVRINGRKIAVVTRKAPRR